MVGKRTALPPFTATLFRCLSGGGFLGDGPDGGNGVVSRHDKPPTESGVPRGALISTRSNERPRPYSGGASRLPKAHEVLGLDVETRGRSVCSIEARSVFRGSTTRRRRWRLPAVCSSGSSLRHHRVAGTARLVAAGERRDGPWRRGARPGRRNRKTARLRADHVGLDPGAGPGASPIALERREHAA